MPIKTFTQFTVLDNIKSKEDYHNLLVLTKLLNVPVYINTTSDNYEKYPNLVFIDEICGNHSRREEHTHFDGWIDRNTYIKFCLNWRYAKMIQL